MAHEGIDSIKRSILDLRLVYIRPVNIRATPQDLDLVTQDLNLTLLKCIKFNSTPKI